MCKEKIPDSTQQIIHLLSEEETDVSLVTPRKTTSVRNPYKRLWEERRINWSYSTTSPYGSSQQGATCAPQAESRSSDVFMQQDEYLLNVAIKESLKSCTVSMSGEVGNKVNLPDSHVDDQREISASTNETYVMWDHYTEHKPRNNW